MLKKYLLLIFLGGFLLAIIFSCEKSTKDEGPKTNREAIEALINYHLYSPIFKGDVFDTIEDTTLAPVFYREITKRDFFIKIDIYDAPPQADYTKYANMVLTDSIEGIFHLLLNGKEYQKDFKAVSKVSGYFEKWGYDVRDWFLKKVAGNNIYSIPGGAGAVTVHLISPSGDYTLSPGQVTSLTKIREVRTFESGDSLTFKIFEPDTSRLFYLHYWKDGNYWKLPFTLDGDTLITGCRISGSGYQHLFIDILDYNTVFDSEAAYKSNAWGILFKVD